MRNGVPAELRPRPSRKPSIGSSSTAASGTKASIASTIICANYKPPSSKQPRLRKRKMDARNSADSDTANRTHRQPFEELKTMETQQSLITEPADRVLL